MDGERAVLGSEEVPVLAGDRALKSTQTEVGHIPVCPRQLRGAGTCPPALPCPLLLSWRDKGLWLEVCPGWGSVLEESREGVGDALENAAHTSCCKWSIHHGASWLVCCAAVLVPPPDMESCAVSGLKIEEAPKYTP